MNDFTKLMIDTGKGSVEQYSVASGNEAIRKRFSTILGIEQGTKGKQLRKAMRKHKVEVYEIIEETLTSLISTGWGDNEFFQTLVEERNLEDGDQNSFYTVDDAVLTVSKFSGNHHDLDRVKLNMGEEYSIKTSWYGVKVFEEWERFMAGKIDWASFINKLYESLNYKVSDMLFSTFAGLSLETGTYVGSGALDDSTPILALAEKLEAKTRKPIMFVGTKTALSKLDKLSQNWASNSMKDEKNLNGFLGNFMGYPTMAISQTMRPDESLVYSNDVIYLIPMGDDKPIKYVNEGDIQYKEVSDGTSNRDQTIEAEVQVKMGFAWVAGTSYGAYNIA